MSPGLPGMVFERSFSGCAAAGVRADVTTRHTRARPDLERRLVVGRGLAPSTALLAALRRAALLRGGLTTRRPRRPGVLLLAAALLAAEATAAPAALGRVDLGGG